ncbi:hypothetical protein [Sphingomonas abaci]|uniref:Uncharacterized protein n=1 Tax=Sphingomonas abaci TaxID=237611 RepID=A0A7W7AI64_9SPHN|nr:hypothetical protein [Sphingomonas abaci]MBB4616695.1 hypothetical protein [Sphingomonas abaci]
MRRSVHAILFVALGVVIGKWCQYTAVAYLAGWLGFEAASLIGLAPFVAALLVLTAHHPRHFAFRQRD